jgi:SAM-dependent methyltransferase
MKTGAIYHEDLAEIHIAGYAFHWEQAAPAVLGFLHRNGITSGTIIDLGCGGGQWLELLAKKGYTVFGIDQSASMIRAARRRVPQGKFIDGSFADVELPPCDAVTSLGEPINYLDNDASIRRAFGRVHEALRPGGIFIFDARERATGPVEPRVSARMGDTWACISTIEEDGEANTILRDITTFRKVGRTYRRSHEVHRLAVYSKTQYLDWLRNLGFRVRTYRAYGDYRLAERQSVYIARKQ